MLQEDNSKSKITVPQRRYRCPFPDCTRSFRTFWRLKVHHRAQPDIRGSGKERGHGVELPFCPACQVDLQHVKYHKCSVPDTCESPNAPCARKRALDMQPAQTVEPAKVVSLEVKKAPSEAAEMDIVLTLLKLKHSVAGASNNTDKAAPMLLSRPTKHIESRSSSSGTVSSDGLQLTCGRGAKVALARRSPDYHSDVSATEALSSPCLKAAGYDNTEQEMSSVKRRRVMGSEPVTVQASTPVQGGTGGVSLRDSAPVPFLQGTSKGPAPISKMEEGTPAGVAQESSSPAQVDTIQAMVLRAFGKSGSVADQEDVQHPLYYLPGYPKLAACINMSQHTLATWTPWNSGVGLVPYPTAAGLLAYQWAYGMNKS